MLSFLMELKMFSFLVNCWKLTIQGLQYLLLPLHHLCGFLDCYGVIEPFWGFNGRFTYYRWKLTPFWTTWPLSMQSLRRSIVAQCHQGVEGGVPKPSYSLLLWVQRCLAKVNPIHWLLDSFQLNRRLLLTSSCLFFPSGFLKSRAHPVL